MSIRRRRCAYRQPSRSRQLSFESLESRRVLSSLIAADYWYGGHVYGQRETRDDGFVVAQDSQAVSLDVTRNDFPWYWNGYYTSSDDLNKSISEFTLKTEPEHGTATVVTESNIIHYTPDAGFVGVDRLIYTLTNGAGDESTATAFINVVAPFVAIDDWFRIEPGSEDVELNLVANDRSNAHGLALPPLTIAEVGAPAHGTVTIREAGSGVIYRPTNNYQGTDEFVYTIQDAAGHRSQATVRLRVATAAEEAQGQWIDKREHGLRETALERIQTTAGTWSSYEFLDYSIGLRAVSAELMGTSLTYSVTNVQVEGVNEGDLVKVEGDFIYLLSSRTEDGQSYQQLVVVDASVPTEPHIVSRVNFRGKVLKEYVVGDRLLVISTGGLAGGESKKPNNYSNFAATILELSSDGRAQPIEETFVEGEYFDSRSVGEFVYLVTKSISPSESRLPSIQQVCHDERPACFAETVAEYLTRVKTTIRELAAEGDGVRFVALGPDGTELRRGTVGFNSDQIPQDNWSAVISIGVHDAMAGPTDAAAIHGSLPSVIYASPNSLYVTSSAWSNTLLAFRSGLGGDGSSTRLEKITLGSDGQVEWAAEGSVPGHIQNQFSLDERDGYLRVFAGQQWGGANGAFVFEQQENKLEIVGRVENLAPGERIYSARFDGDYGYVVTFVKVDPLFAIDFSDPRNPIVLGQLKTPGYSQYLQFVGENKLLGIGRDADDGLFQEMQVSLFDLSDLSAPSLLHRYSFEGGRNMWSPLMSDAWNLGDHHTVSYFASHQVLALPFYSGNNSWWSWQQQGSEAETAIRLLHIDAETGIRELGTVSLDGRFDPFATRTVRIGDYLYAISPNMIKVVELMEPANEHAVLYIGRGPTNDAASTRSHEKISIDVMANDDLPPSDAADVAIFSISQPIQGTAVISADGRNVEYTPPAGEFVGEDTFTYQVRTASGSLEEAMVAVQVKRVWHNVENARDIDHDGVITPIDVLRLINFINSHGSLSNDDADAAILALTGEGEPTAVDMLDVNDDRFITAMDALQLINFFAPAPMVIDGPSEESDDEYESAVMALFGPEEILEVVSA